MTARIHSFDGDAFAVLLQKEETYTSPQPPQGKRKSKRPLLDSVPLRVQQAAIEECVSFINSLSYGHSTCIGDTTSQASRLPSFSRRISPGGSTSPSTVMSRAPFSSLRISDKGTASESQHSNHRPQSEGVSSVLEWRSKMIMSVPSGSHVPIEI